MTFSLLLKSEVNLLRAVERCQADLSSSVTVSDNDEFRREFADRLDALGALLATLQRDAAAVWQVGARGSLCCCRFLPRSFFLGRHSVSWTGTR